MDEVLNILNKKLQDMNNHKKCTDEYSLLKSDEERIIFTINLLQEYSISIDIRNNEKKSVIKSREFNDKANKLLLSPKSDEELDLDYIVELYTRSVAYAPNNSQELAFAYANRSAALFKAKLFDDCIKDIDRALYLNYPDKWKAKLYARKVRCLMILKSDLSFKSSNLIIETSGMPLKSIGLSSESLQSHPNIENSSDLSINEAKDAVNNQQISNLPLKSSDSITRPMEGNPGTLTLSNSLDLSLKSSHLTPEPTVIQKCLGQAEIWLEKMDENDAGRKVVEKTINDPKKMASIAGKMFEKLEDLRNFPSIPQDNPEIPGASSAVQLKYSEMFGKHVVATRDIEIGEIIAVQKSYASVLSVDKFYTHCWHCLKQVWSGIGCKNCVNVIFCSELCQDTAYNEYHELECQVIGSLINLGLNNFAIMSLRLAIKALKEAGSLQSLKGLVEKINSTSDIRTNGFTEDTLDDKKYASIYTLANNTEKRTVPDLFGRSLNATIIVHSLAKNTNVFGEMLTGDLDELKNNSFATFIGGLIMRHQQIIPSNVHSVTEEGLFTTPVERAAAMMPFYSLINHSCNPMVERQSFGDTIALIAVVPIKKDEQIFDNYGLHYAITPKEIRQKQLKQQYHFDCSCEACEQNWPLYGQFGSYSDQKVRKEVRKKLNSTLKNFDKYYKYAGSGAAENKPEVIMDLIKMLKVLYKYVYLPCMEVNKVMETLKKIYSVRGNRMQSIN